MWRCALLGVLLGAWVGVISRLWMRLVVAYPDMDPNGFTWPGTLGIIVSAAVGGVGLGLVRGARLTGRSRTWRWAGLLSLPFLGAPMGLSGFLFSPVVGERALANRRPAWLGWTVAALWFAALPLIGFAVGDPVHRDENESVHYVSISVGLWTLGVLLASGGKELFADWHGAQRGTAGTLTTPDPLLGGRP